LNTQAVWVEDQTLANLNAGAEGAFQPLVKSPMSGKVTQVLVEAGQSVEAGAVLLCLEAMKMEHRIVAKSAAVVESVLVKPGDQMNLNQLMIQLKEA
ncbi:MAG TPA: acetyl-CoA carboxylase biotin carboxyl carrier protein subunit, partial [Pseudomonadales bacterium]|nr:acetyl-CoA carboxylase biotin carboxyl carrier protein subunit [Pseudomonadales bacterium]